jgi:type II secretory pathway pseudopilin PulG
MKLFSKYIRHHNSALHKNRKNQAGFTLIEWMTSMITLGIGIVALISLQSTSLNTHMATRDNQIGGSLADQFLEMLQIDALRWEGQLNSANLRYLNPSKYTMSTSTQDRWHPYTQRPVNFQMRYQTHTSQGAGARYCLYFSYRWAGIHSNVNTFQDEMLEVNAMVITPRYPNGLPAQPKTGLQCANVQQMFWTCDAKLVDDTTCEPRARFLYFRQLSRATYVRRNISKLGNWYDQIRQ